MVDVVKMTEWENERVRLVELRGLARHSNYPFDHYRLGRFLDVPGRVVKRLIVHSTGGPFDDGLDAAVSLSEWSVSAPRLAIAANGRAVLRKTRGGVRPIRIGGGLGLPAAATTFLVPHRPAVVHGKFEVYRINSDSMITGHTGGTKDVDGVAVSFAGTFHTRHSPGFSDRHPHDSALEAGRELIIEYLLPRYSLATFDVHGPFEYGAPTNPGDVLETWIRAMQGDDTVVAERPRFPSDPVEPLDRRPLTLWIQRQLALAELGYDLGSRGADGSPGFGTRSAIEAFQAIEHLVVDGVFGPRTEHAMRIALARESR